MRAGKGKQFTAGQLRRGIHRRRIGGQWEKIGKLQLDFLVEQGLSRDSHFLDVGCGSLRAGVRLVDYLNPRNYYGIDINEALIQAGYDVELSGELREKLPRDHLRRTERFDCDFGVEFDLAIAQSLFTHIPLNDIRLCLYRVAKVMKPGGRFFVTFFEGPADLALDEYLPPRAKEGTPRRGERDPFWYWSSDIQWAASFAPWSFRYIGEWGHPVGQRIAELTRT